MFSLESRNQFEIIYMDARDLMYRINDFSRSHARESIHVNIMLATAEEHVGQLVDCLFDAKEEIRRT